MISTLMIYKHEFLNRVRPLQKCLDSVVIAATIMRNAIVITNSIDAERRRYLVRDILVYTGHFDI